MSNYTQGYSHATTSSHASRTAHSDAGFLLPYVKPTDSILDVGCGPATITAGLAALVPQGFVIGVDISEAILDQARHTLAPIKNLTFRQADLLAGLPFMDKTFDVVYSSQLFPHLPTTEQKVKALTEMRRVLKPCGILATRDAAELHFYPRHHWLDKLWTENMNKALHGGKSKEEAWFPGGEMPKLYRQVGFAAEGIQVGAGTTVYSGAEARRMFVQRYVERLKEGDPYLKSWKDVGIIEEEIAETKDALGRWVGDEDAWYVALQAEIIATKQE